MDSNVGGFNYKNLSEAAVYGQTVCQLLNCSTGLSACNSTCMRAASAADVVSAWGQAAGNVIDFIIADLQHILDGFLQFTPVVDGVIVTAEPQEVIDSGNWARVPVLLGTNTNEGETFIYDAVDFPLPGFLINLALDVVFDPAASAQITQQPRYLTNVSDGRTPLSNVLTDYWFRCASMQFAKAAVAAGQPAWAYRFDHVFSASQIFPKFGLPAICVTAVCHASELPFAFHMDVPSLNATFTPVEAALAATMVDYWAAFVKTGNPNNGTVSPGSMASFPFPAWDPVARTNLVLNDTLTVESSAPLCTLWDTLGYFW
jgi:carboxylesterase type B